MCVLFPSCSNFLFAGSGDRDYEQRVDLKIVEGANVCQWSRGRWSRPIPVADSLPP